MVAAFALETTYGWPLKLAACYARHPDRFSLVMEHASFVEHQKAIFLPNLPLPKTIAAVVWKALFGILLVCVTVEAQQYSLPLLEALAGSLAQILQRLLHQRQILTLALVSPKQ